MTARWRTRTRWDEDKGDEANGNGDQNESHGGPF